MKTLVLYVFSELNERVNRFIQDAIFLDPDIDFLVINNSSENQPILPDYVIYFKCNNIGFDFGGWSRGLLYNDIYKEYDAFIFVSSQAAGPFVPSYFQGKWTDIYLNGLTDTIKLFGSSINTNDIQGTNDPEGSSHVQSYIFAMPSDAVSYLISKDIFSIKSYSKTTSDIIKNKERRMSRLIIENGWNIGCLMTYYKDVDFRFLVTRPSEYKAFLGDPLTTKNFSDKLFNNFYELVFINKNRFDFNLNGFSIS